jgi:p-aminobenzoyl-glutamate transporter AbgT
MSQNKPTSTDHSENNKSKRGMLVKLLDGIEWLGNKLPDPAVLFVIGLALVWVLSCWMSTFEFTEVKPGTTDQIKVENLLTLDKFAHLLSHMVKTFVDFPPLGVVLVALLGVGVAEHSGFLNACLKSMLDITPKQLLTPMLLLVAIVSHTAADAGYVLVIPIGGVMFYAAGRHPLAGIAAAFAGVSGGFSANFIPSGIDPLLSGLTQTGVDIVDKSHSVNPLCNIIFTALSSALIIGVGWFLTDVVIEPRLKRTAVDGDPEDLPKFESLTPADRRGMWAGIISIVICLVGLVIWLIPSNSAMRDPNGDLTSVRGKGIKTGVSFDVDNEMPVVANVDAGSPGAAAGIQSGNTILSVGGKPVANSTAAESAFKSLPADTPTVIVIEREKFTANVKLTEGDDAGINLDPTQPTTTIQSVQPGSPADIAGLKSGDVVERINNVAVESTESAQATIESFKKTKAFNVSVNRESESVPLAIVPAKNPGAPLMESIVPLIFIFFIVPGLVHGYVSGKYKSHREAVKGMAKTMETMGYYLVLVFFAALFIYAFTQSNIAILLAVKGANFIDSTGASPAVAIIGIILLSATVNLLIGSASAKWAMLAPVFVPMLMYAGLSPELTQAAYRVGDSSTNIITPMMPYFPLVVVFCQRYVKNTGIGTVAAMMLPFSITFLITWTLFLLAYWALGIPLGLDAGYTYEIPVK